MKKISFLSAIIFLDFLLLNSCCDPNYDPLTSEEVKWAPYSLNQNTIFVNDSNFTDTLIVSQYEKKDMDETNSDGCHETWEEISCHIKSSNDTNILFSIFIYTGKIDLIANKINALYDIKSDLFNMSNCSADFLNNTTINDTTYYDVIYLKDNGPYYYSTKIKELYYGKSIGIISYKDENDITWYKN